MHWAEMERDVNLLQPTSVRGTVYGVFLNDRTSLDRLGAAMDDAPYQGAPRAPVLYIKPAGTLCVSGSAVTLPAGEAAVEVGATVGIVMGRSASRVAPQEVASVIAGYLLVADLSLPHRSCYRPAIREKCFDGACPVADTVVPAHQLGHLADLVLRTLVNGQELGCRSLSDLVRDVPQLVAEVSSFMTLQRGDVLLVGVLWQAPQAQVGDTVRVEAPGLGAIEFTLQATEGGIA